MKFIYIDPTEQTYEWDVGDVHAPLDTFGVIATLNAVLGIWPLQDAANAAGLTPDDLIREAQAWAAAQQ